MAKTADLNDRIPVPGTDMGTVVVERAPKGAARAAAPAATAAPPASPAPAATPTKADAVRRRIAGDDALDDDDDLDEEDEQDEGEEGGAAAEPAVERTPAAPTAEPAPATGTDDDLTEEEQALVDLLGLKPPEPAPAPSEPAPAAGPAKESGSKVVFTAEQQAYIDRMLQDRLSRDRTVNQKAVDEALVMSTGKTLEQLTKESIENRIKELQDERDLDEDTARQMAELEAKDRQREAERQQEKADTVRRQRAADYEKARAEYSSNPFARLYAAEVDEFSGSGGEVDYKAALTWVLGEKVLSGELTQRIRTAAEKATQKRVAERAQVVPVRSGGAAPVQGLPQLTAAQKRVADAMGVPHDRYAANLARIQKSKGAAGQRRR